jgi:hypothetical protein
MQRWQRPVGELFKQTGKPFPGKGLQQVDWKSAQDQVKPKLKPTFPMTLIRVKDSVSPELSNPNQEGWLRQGNVLVLVGDRPPDKRSRAAATDAPFTSVFDSPVGKVKIETTRRWLNAPIGSQLLGDRAGSVVWEESHGDGKIIYVSTPFLAANAYQDEPGNFKYLQRLVTEFNHPIWVDEYIHGYVDPTTEKEEAEARNPLLYLAQTPLLLVSVQALIILAVMLVGFNQRMGRAKTIKTPTVDNSEAYIRALAGVLEKANCSDFVVETIGKAEQVAIQRSLGLGVDPVEVTMVTQAWTQQTGQPVQVLEQVLRLPMQLQAGATSTKISHTQLVEWLEQLKKVRSHLPR